MSIDIYEDQLQNVWLFGRSVLYTTEPIPREEVPEGWYCYDLRGSTKCPDRPRALVDHANQHFAGCILSDVPLKSSRSQGELVPNLFWANAIPVTLAEHCAEEGIPCPQPRDTQTADLERESVGYGMAMGMGF
ncbi:LPD28 domain-containing protein [Oscillibacter sp.]|uniref:LPD28 domain-containing protein n=1 Tax=Oscillibacter sp. TaxID=1945593 RepID=UPI0027298E4C|nr:LPD28 domain-containing protein [Oscillibacter sp.]